MQQLMIRIEGYEEEYVARLINEVVLKATAKHKVKLKGYEQKTLIPAMAEIRMEAEPERCELQIPDFMKKGSITR